MSRSLRVRWQNQLAVAQASPSWQAQVEVRVLLFLLSRYNWNKDEAPLPPFPLYEGEAPYGRARLPLSRHHLGQRLKHIAQTGKERHQDVPSLTDWNNLALQDTLKHQRNEARRERFRTRHERCYW